MLWEQTTLTIALLREREKAISETALMDAVQAILARDEAQRKAIKNRLHESDTIPNENQFVFDLLETGRLFHIDQVKAICLDYRLRFLDSHLYKNTFPEEAVSKIKALEKAHDTTLSGFKIMAPSKQFYLKNYDDPLLFAPIGNGYYYLVHQWGNDLNPLRRLLVRPLRDFGSLLLFLAAASFVFALLITKLFFRGSDTDEFLLIAFLFTFKSFCGIALYYGFWKGKNFTTAIWDSPYYNR